MWGSRLRRKGPSANEKWERARGKLERFMGAFDIKMIARPDWLKRF